MHAELQEQMQWLVDEYVHRGDRVLDVGSFNVNGCFRDAIRWPKNVEYVGCDIEPGPNVDVVVPERGDWGLEGFDVVISGSAFEHMSRPWEVIDQIRRALRHLGKAIIIAPSRGPCHHFPDCFRYKPDGLHALGESCGMTVFRVVDIHDHLEEEGSEWGDVWAVFIRDDEGFISTPPPSWRGEIALDPQKRKAVVIG
jgi:SAM-dependent methyltransferase